MRSRTWRRALAFMSAPGLAIALAVGIAQPAAAVDNCGVTGNLMDNCGFEDGNDSSWSLSGDLSHSGVSGSASVAHSGGYYLLAGPDEYPEDPLAVSQDVETVDGGTYQVSFWLRGGDDSDPTTLFDATVGPVYPEGSSTPSTVTLVSLDSVNVSAWTEYTYTFRAAGPVTLTFHFFNYPSYWYFDDVSVVATGATTSVTDIASPDGYTCPVAGSTMVGFEDQAEYTVLDGTTLGGVTFATGSNWTVAYELQPYWTADGDMYAGPVGVPSGRVDFAAGPVSDVSLLVTSTGNVRLEAYDASDALIGETEPSPDNLSTGHMTELRVTSPAGDIDHVIVHDTMNYFAIDDICYPAAAQAVDTTTALESDNNPSVYGEDVGLTATVTPASGTDVPTGSVLFMEGTTQLAEEALDTTGAATATLDDLTAGTHTLTAVYVPATDSGFTESTSDPLDQVVSKAPTTVAFNGDYLVIAGKLLTLKAKVASPAAACVSGRDVQFALSNTETHTSPTLSTDGAGLTTWQPSTTGWAAGEYDLLISVAANDNCLAADSSAAMDVVEIADPGSAATGGGWYFYKASGDAKRVNFGFTAKLQSDGTYKGNLLLMNQGAWRVKGQITAYTRNGTSGTAAGVATVYKAICETVLGVTTCTWVEQEQGVSFLIKFSDLTSGKSSKKTNIYDLFGLTNLGFSASNLPVSTPKPLKGGDIQLG